MGNGLSPLHGLVVDRVIVAAGWLVERSRAARRESIAAIIERNGGQDVTAERRAERRDIKKRFSMHSFGAMFVEVRVDRT